MSLSSLCTPLRSPLASTRPRLSPVAAMASRRSLNRLAQSRSPYLLQHADNPVDWFEWGTDAFNKAKQENKPIFLSVGYSACHWCHVLAHESFEDNLTAKLMNEHYVNIKVDREERPDVDRLYMLFLQATTGGGGWPMSVWLTPELHPFFAGTYFPPGRFRQILHKLAEVWEEDPERCVTAGKQVIEQLRTVSNISSGSSAVSVPELASSVYEYLDKRFDTVHGGFGGAPKFPQPAQTVHFLTRFAALNMRAEDSTTKQQAEHARDMAVQTLTHIYRGGIRDAVGGGFARYSVDERWHVPHFEKMLYDQAQLLMAAVELSLLVPHAPTLRRMATEIIAYVARDLRSPEGGFYSAEDADSLPAHGSTVKKEGAFYVWTAQELDTVLGADAPLFRFHFGVEEHGNCDPQHDIQGELRGQNVLYTAHSTEDTAAEFGRAVDDVERTLACCLDRLRERRDAERPRPHLDDKILTGWNGLMISGLARASEALHADAGQAAAALCFAEDAAAFIKEHLYDATTGELRRSYRHGPGPQGQADDYAFLIQGLLDLYEASAKEEYAVWAVRLQATQDALFYDAQGGGYFASAPDAHILVRVKDAQDGAEPSAASVTLANLQRLAHVAEDRRAAYGAQARSVLAAHAQLLGAAPFVLGTMVGAALGAQRGGTQLVVTGPRGGAGPLVDVVRGAFVPGRVLVHLDPARPPSELAKVNATLRGLIGGLAGDGGRASVRVCEGFRCGLPIEDAEELRAVLY
ncbi:hypothetical protein B0H21DRAFT_735904 [Amylocystis lapponica]|nr:hypothetical protein B0H21DRAFT_735904 [Amylocystis lapponica]